MRRAAILCLVLLGAGAVTAHAVAIGGGVFGGASVPIVQDDNGTGSQFGVRVPVSVLHFLTVEPYFARSGLGQVEKEFGGRNYTRDGQDVTAFGINAMLGAAGLLTGFPLYPYAGIASHKLTRAGNDDRTEVGYNFGLGLGFGVPMGLSVHVRGELNLIVTGDTSRKFANATLGVHYKLFSAP